MRVGDVIEDKYGVQHILKQLEPKPNDYGHYNIITTEGLILFNDGDGYEVAGSVVQNAV